VVNLAAGLDSRPYRLALPPSLAWVEVDLPEILDEKERLLAGESPHCRLQRVSADLRTDRARVLADLPGERVLVLTEGLIGYLAEEQVASLTRDLFAVAAIREWVTDLTSPKIRAIMTRNVGSELGSSQIVFAPENGVGFFEAFGWRVLEVRSLLREAIRLRRLPLRYRPFGWLPDPNPRRFGAIPWSGVVRLGR
jgi:O-methyltransferase involved in polyketide biosynthesis